MTHFCVLFVTCVNFAGSSFMMQTCPLAHLSVNERGKYSIRSIESNLNDSIKNIFIYLFVLKNFLELATTFKYLAETKVNFMP